MNIHPNAAKQITKLVITDDEAYANTALAEAFTASDKQP